MAVSGMEWSGFEAKTLTVQPVPLAHRTLTAAAIHPPLPPITLLYTPPPPNTASGGHNRHWCCVCMRVFMGLA